MQDKIANEYFEWLFELVCGERYSKEVSYRKLLTKLHDIEFRYFVPNDQNRASDGEDLRYRFTITHGYNGSVADILDSILGPCSVFEMIVALAIRCEENIMDNPSVGDRTGQWFWGMIASLGLRTMVDSRFDEVRVNQVIDRFLNREYEPNGQGGLFTIERTNRDLREVEIWYQMWWFIDTIA